MKQSTASLVSGRSKGSNPVTVTVSVSLLTMTIQILVRSGSICVHMMDELFQLFELFVHVCMYDGGYKMLPDCNLKILFARKGALVGVVRRTKRSMVHLLSCGIA